MHVLHAATGMFYRHMQHAVKLPFPSSSSPLREGRCAWGQVEDMVCRREQKAQVGEYVCRSKGTKRGEREKAQAGRHSKAALLCHAMPRMPFSSQVTKSLFDLG